jgi:hypothetical protein
MEAMASACPDISLHEVRLRKLFRNISIARDSRFSAAEQEYAFYNLNELFSSAP